MGPGLALGRQKDGVGFSSCRSYHLQVFLDCESKDKARSVRLYCQLGQSPGPKLGLYAVLAIKGRCTPLGHLRAVFHSVVVFVFFPRLINTFTPCGSLTKR